MNVRNLMGAPAVLEESMNKPKPDADGHVCYAAPVFEMEEDEEVVAALEGRTDDVAQGSRMECPCCGNDYIKFMGQPVLEKGQLKIEMACSAGHRWTFLFGEQDKQMIARCWIYNWPEWPGSPKPIFR